MISRDDPQVVEAMNDLQESYKRIAELKSLENKGLQFAAIPIIEFHEIRIKNIEQALWKKGIINFVRKEDMANGW
jgi:hypothetical protein